MDIRKIAVVGGFAVGAALTFAPLASADTDITSTLDSEISLLNTLFTGDADLASVPSADITGGTTAGSFETIVSGDVGAVDGTAATGITPFAELLYGFNPANLTLDPGSFDVLNGAVGEFDDAFNVGLYALENGGALVPVADDNGIDLIHTGATVDALDTGSVTGAFTTFFEAGVSDLAGYFDLPSLF
jgi:hypothetical protein